MESVEIEREEEERTDKGKEGDAEVKERGEGNRGGEENGIFRVSKEVGRGEKWEEEEGGMEGAK